MAVINGYLLKQAEVFGLLSPLISPELSAYALDIWPPHTNAMGATSMAAIITSWPVEANPTLLNGYKVGSYVDDYYYRIHIIPTALALGNLITDQTRPVIVWNAFLTSKYLEAVAFPSGSGISVTEPTPAPFSIPALKELTYNVIISAVGPPTIDLDLMWAVSGTNYFLRVTGRRIIVWSFPPDWGPSFTETLEWLTNVTTAYEGDEQREVVRSKPRRAFEYQLMFTDQFAGTIQNLLFGWQHRTFALPIWYDLTTTTATLNIAGLVITADTTNRCFFVGGLVLLYADPLNYEVREILSFTATTITMTNGVEKLWPIGSKVYPINIGRFPSAMQSVRATDGILTMVVAFDADPTLNDPYIPIVSAPITYSGYEMVDKAPNWSTPISYENVFEASLIDYKTGAVVAMPSRTFPQITRSFEWVFKTKAELVALRGLLGRLQGRAKAVYMPTWFSDFQLFSTEISSATTLRVKLNEFSRMVGVNSTLNVVAIVTRGNPVVYRKILTVSEIGGYTALGLDGPVNYALDSTTLSRISLVHLCRMTTDRATISYLTSSVGVMKAAFTLVKA